MDTSRVENTWFLSSDRKGGFLDNLSAGAHRVLGPIHYTNTRPRTLPAAADDLLDFPPQGTQRHPTQSSRSSKRPNGGAFEIPANTAESSSITVTSAYTSAAQCAPTRACLLTGRDLGRDGVWAVDRIRGKEEFRKMVPPTNNTELPLSEQTIADALGRAGYATAMFGKWHLGDEGRYYPSQRGEADQGRQIP